MLEIKNPEHLKEVKRFAEVRGKLEQLQGKLDWLKNFGGNSEETKVELMSDFGGGPSFVFNVYGRDPRTGFIDQLRFNGGLIYHGPEDGFGSGSAPSFAVTLEPVDGWEIHT